MSRRYVALEEHCLTPAVHAAHERLAAAGGMASTARFTAPLADIGAGRLAAMDAAGIDVQVLSHHAPGAQLADRGTAIATARAANDELSAAIARHPDRFAGWATLPTTDAAAAAAELRRAVQDLGLVGAMVHGRSGGGWLDQPDFDVVLATAVDLDVPLYLHPTEPPAAIKDMYYRGLGIAPDARDDVDADQLEHMLATAGWGWHVETGTHALRLILAGVFDRHPSLQVVLGHWGELIPFYLGRIDVRLHRLAGHLRRSPAEYFTTNFHVTPGGLESLPPLLLCASVLGADRILYSADHPFGAPTLGRAFIDEAPIAETDKDKIAYKNAEALLRLGDR
jgi:predicted TIM-barrel fold metal-dependent hydrolase